MKIFDRVQKPCFTQYYLCSYTFFIVESVLHSHCLQSGVNEDSTGWDTPFFIV